MRKLYILIAFLFLAAPGLMAQCTPNPNMGSSMIDPPKLPDGITGQAYSVNFSFRIPKDTFLMNGSTRYDVTIDRAELLDLRGIPSGFSYACNPSSCTFAGGSVGCALLTGNPNGTQVGEYPIKVVTMIYYYAGTSGPFQTIQSDSNYVFKITFPEGIELVRRDVHPLKVAPNPTNGITRIELRDVKEYTLSVYDVLGKTVLSRQASTQSYLEEVELDLSSHSKGLYTVVLRSGEETFVSKLALR